MANNPNRRAGILFFKVDGAQYDAKGNFTYNLGVLPNAKPLSVLMPCMVTRKRRKFLY